MQNLPLNYPSSLHLGSDFVTFRHLAMLAQTKSRDEDVWASLGLKDRPTTMRDRLQRMRTWVQSRHFPDELRSPFSEEPNLEAIGQLDDETLQFYRTIRPFAPVNGMLQVFKQPFQARQKE